MRGAAQIGVWLVLVAACPDSAPEPERAPETERAPEPERAPESESPAEPQSAPESESPAEADSESASESEPAPETEVHLEVNSGMVEPASPLPAGAPVAIVHGTVRPDAPLRLVVFLHGWRGCARVLVNDGPTRCRQGRGTARTGWGLGARFDAADTGALLVVPQLSWLARSGDPGRFTEPRFFRGLLAKLLAGPLADPLAGARGPDDVETIVLVAHSAGYEAARAVIEHGGMNAFIEAVVLMDALYDHTAFFADFAANSPSRRIVSLYTGRGDTYRQSRALARRLGDAIGKGEVARDPDAPLAEAIATRRAVVARSPHPHGAIPRRQLEPVLRGLARASVLGGARP